MIYIASKTKHAPLWRHLRSVGWPVISTWIDEAGIGETSDFNNLWERCISESQRCKEFILYKEPEDILKGAWIELGVAMVSKARIMAIGIEDYTIAKSNRIEHFSDVISALFTTDYNK